MSVAWEGEKKQKGNATTLHGWGCLYKGDLNIGLKQIQVRREVEGRHGMKILLIHLPPLLIPGLLEEEEGEEEKSKAAKGRVGGG